MLTSPLPHKINQGMIHLLRMTRTQKVRTTIHSPQLGILRIHKQLNLLLRISHTINNIIRPMQPQHRTADIKQPPVKSTSLAQVNSRHPRAPAPIIALIVRLDGPPPEIPRLRGAVLPEPDVDQEVAAVGVRLEGGRDRGGGPFVDGARAGGDAVPAAEFAGALALAVHGCAEGSDAFDPVRLQMVTCH
jgi:hypothetical protein